MLNTGRSNLRVFVPKFVQTCLGVRPTGSCKMRHIFSSRLRLERAYQVNIIEKFEAPSLIDTSFAPIIE